MDGDKRNGGIGGSSRQRGRVSRGRVVVEEYFLERRAFGGDALEKRCPADMMELEYGRT